MPTNVTAPTLTEIVEGIDSEVVRGPAGAVTNNNLAKWDGTSGRLVKDGGAGGGGGGDVSGPGASVDGNLAIFDGTTGTLIEDSGVAIADVSTAIATSAALASAIGAPSGIASLDGSGKHTVSEIPFGTTSTTVAAGNHGHTGMGDVVGPSSATDGRVAVMDGTTGKLIKVGPRLESDLVAGPASSVADNLASFNGTGGKTAKDSGIAAAAVVTLTGTQTLENKTHVQATSTSFPGSPVDGQRHWRSDHNEWYRWNSSLSKWLGETSHTTQFGNARGSAVSTFDYGYCPAAMTDAGGAPLYFGDRKVRLLWIAWGLRGVTGGGVWTLRLRLNTSGSDTFVASNTATSVANTWVKKNFEAVSVSLAANDNVVLLATRASGSENYGANGVLIWCWEG